MLQALVRDRVVPSQVVPEAWHGLVIQQFEAGSWGEPNYLPWGEPNYLAQMIFENPIVLEMYAYHDSVRRRVILLWFLPAMKSLFFSQSAWSSPWNGFQMDIGMNYLDEMKKHMYSFRACVILRRIYYVCSIQAWTSFLLKLIKDLRLKVWPIKRAVT